MTWLDKLFHVGIMQLVKLYFLSHDDSDAEKFEIYYLLS